MTDAQKAELTRLASESLEAATKYWAAPKTSDYPGFLLASLAAEKRLADSMLAMGIDRFVADDLEFRRNGDCVVIRDHNPPTLP